MRNSSRKLRVIYINDTKIYIHVKIKLPIIMNYNFNASDILYKMPREIKKYLTRSDFALVISVEPHTLETLEVLEILLWNFEQVEEYEYCCVLRDEINFRVKTYNTYKDGQEKEKEGAKGENMGVPD